MSLASFGVARILCYILTNEKIKSKREVFMLVDFLLQAALVGNILWIIMFAAKEVSQKNYLVLLAASLAAGVVSSIVDTQKIFAANSKYKVPKPDSSDRNWLIFYVFFVLAYIIISVVMGYILYK